MRASHDVVGHHAQLGVLDGDEALFLGRMTAPRALINYTRIAGRLPLHASSRDLVRLAHGPADMWRRLLDGCLHRCTPNTPADAARLRAVLADVRQRDYAHCPGCVHPDALGVSAPVRDARGEVGAAPAVIVPNESAASSVVPVVRTAARGISRALGAPDAPR